MQHDTELQRKVLLLMVAESGLRLSPDRLALLSGDAGINEQLASILQRLHEASAADVPPPACLTGEATVAEYTATALAEDPAADPGRLHAPVCQAEPAGAVGEPPAPTSAEPAVGISSEAADEPLPAAPADAPAQTVSEAPAHPPAELPAPAPADAPAQNASEAPAHPPAELPAPAPAPADAPAQGARMPLPPAPAAEWQKHRFDELSPPPAVNGMRPGQIPQASVSPALRPRPQAKMNIANARVGSPFSAEIEIALDNGARALIEQVSFPDETGLTFDAQNGVVSGTPLQSGDLILNVVWSCPGYDAAGSSLVLIVNPDPRSLWKIIDPPADAPYFKANTDHQAIRAAGTQLIAASRRGRSHEHVGAFRDDDFFISQAGASGWNIMLVADGAGSAKNSREGSRLVTRTTGEYLTSQLNGSKGQELAGHLTRWAVEDRRSVGETFIGWFHKASVMAINTLNNAAIMAEQPVKSFATTLLAVVSCRHGDELFAAAYWIGDGAIAAYGPRGKVRLLGTPDSGEYAGQTRFLDAEALQDPEFNKRVSIGKWRDVSHLVLMTDGVSDPRFETDNGLQDAAKWDALMDELSPILQGEQQPDRQLAEWLNFFSPGNHDDRTLIVSHYADEPQSVGE